MDSSARVNGFNNTTEEKTRVRAVKNFKDKVYNDEKEENKVINLADETVKRRRLIQPEPVLYYSDIINDEEAGIKEKLYGIPLKEVEYHTPMGKVATFFQKIGIIPSKAWTDGPSKSWAANIVINMGREIAGIHNETEADIAQKNIIKSKDDLVFKEENKEDNKCDNIDALNNLEIKVFDGKVSNVISTDSKKHSGSGMEALFYEENECCSNLDEAPYKY